MKRELVERAAAGDRTAYEHLARSSAGQLYAIAFRIVRDADLAHDALQQALIAMWQDLPSLREPDRFDAWTYRLIVRAATEEVRRGRRRTVPVRLVRISDGSESDEPAATDDALLGIGDRDAIERAFAQLTADQRAAVVLRYYVGLTLDEIAVALAIPAGTAASRVHYGIRLLRASLEAADRTVSSEAYTA